MELRWEPAKPNKYSLQDRARVYSFCYVCCALLTSVISCMKEKKFDLQGDAYVSDALSCTALPCHIARWLESKKMKCDFLHRQFLWKL